MAETDTLPTANASASPTPMGGISAPVQQSAAPATQSVASEAEWSKKFKDPNELYKSYSELEKKLGEQGNELGQLRQVGQRMAQEREQYAQAVQAWDNWFKTGLQPHWDKIQSVLQGGGGQPTQQAQPQPGTTAEQAAAWAEGWEFLSPVEQAKRLQQVVSQAATQQLQAGITPALQNWAKQFYEGYQKDLKQREAYFNNYLGLYRQVMDMRLKDPSLDVDKVLDQALQVLSNQVNPLELGKKLATMDLDRETYGKRMVEQAKQDWELAEKNKQMAAASANTGGQPPAFKPRTAGPNRGLSSLRESVAKQILEKHGPSAF